MTEKGNTKTKLTDEQKAGLLAASRLANQIPDFQSFWAKVEERLDIEEDAKKNLVEPRRKKETV